MSSFGRCKPIDEMLHEEAALEAAAKAGDAEAAYYIGAYRYHQGELDEGILRSHPEQSWGATTSARSYQEAIDWWRPWAQRGNPAAQWAYGTAFAEGRGVNQSPSSAIEWWYKAAITCHRAGDREEALTLFNSMRKLDPSNPLARWMSAEPAKPFTPKSRRS